MWVLSEERTGCKSKVRDPNSTDISYRLIAIKNVRFGLGVAFPHKNDNSDTIGRTNFCNSEVEGRSFGSFRSFSSPNENPIKDKPEYEYLEKVRCRFAHP